MTEQDLRREEVAEQKAGAGSGDDRREDRRRPHLEAERKQDERRGRRTADRRREPVEPIDEVDQAYEHDDPGDREGNVRPCRKLGHHADEREGEALDANAVGDCDPCHADLAQEHDERRQAADIGEDSHAGDHRHPDQDAAVRPVERDEGEGGDEDGEDDCDSAVRRSVQTAYRPGRKHRVQSRADGEHDGHGRGERDQ